MKPALLLLFAVLMLSAAPAGAAERQEPQVSTAAEQVEVTLFFKPGCPYCRDAKAFLQSRPETGSWLKVKAVDVSASRQAQDTFQRINAFFDIDQPGVPLILVGTVPFLGFDDAAGVGAELMKTAQACRRDPCGTLASLLREAEQAGDSAGGARRYRRALPEQVDLPVIGAVPVASLSLPALTILLAAVDGFNPCAMWVLIFLVGLLLGMQDRLRMWLLGGAFLLTSGLVYFGFLAAWLNIFIMLGALLWVRIAVGVVALGSGAYYLHAFATDAAAECQVTNLEQRQRIMASLRASVTEKRFLAALAGIVILAAAVNLIELLCSAGIPAVFTDVLAMNDLPVWQYYLYLLLYVGVFMLDDAAIFVLAMVTLHATSMTNRYLRVSHLLGGATMMAIGLLLLFAPGWLAFSL